MDKQKTLSEDTMCTDILISKTIERKIEVLSVDIRKLQDI